MKKMSAVYVAVCLALASCSTNTPTVVKDTQTDQKITLIDDSKIPWITLTPGIRYKENGNETQFDINYTLLNSEYSAAIDEKIDSLSKVDKEVWLDLASSIKSDVIHNQSIGGQKGELTAQATDCSPQNVRALPTSPDAGAKAFSAGTCKSTATGGRLEGKTTARAGSDYQEPCNDSGFTVQCSSVAYGTSSCYSSAELFDYNAFGYILWQRRAANPYCSL